MRGRFARRCPERDSPRAPGGRDATRPPATPGGQTASPCPRAAAAACAPLSVSFLKTQNSHKLENSNIFALSVSQGQTSVAVP